MAAPRASGATRLERVCGRATPDAPERRWLSPVGTAARRFAQTKRKNAAANRARALAEQVKKSGVAGVQELQNETAAFRSLDGD